MERLIGLTVACMLLAGCGAPVAAPIADVQGVQADRTVLRHQPGSEDPKKHKWCPPGKRDDADSGECPEGHQ